MRAMIKLHGFPMSPNTRRALVALEECGVQYEMVPVDLMSGAQKSFSRRSVSLSPTFPNPN